MATARLIPPPTPPAPSVELVMTQREASLVRRVLCSIYPEHVAQEDLDSAECICVIDAIDSAIPR